MLLYGDAEDTHFALHAPNVREDGTPNHYQEAIRYLELANEVSQRTAEGAHALAAMAQVHATLYAAEVEVESIKLMRSARIHANEGTLTDRAKDVLRL